MRGAGADLEIERLLQQAAMRGPEGGQLENEILKSHEGRFCLYGVRRRSRRTRSDFSVFSRCIEMSERCTVSSSLIVRRSAGRSPTRSGAELRDAVRNAIAPSESVPRASG